MAIYTITLQVPAVTPEIRASLSIIDHLVATDLQYAIELLLEQAAECSLKGATVKVAYIQPNQGGQI
jgi:hypothetical protein